MNILAKVKDIFISLKGYRIINSTWGGGIVQDSKVIQPYGFDSVPNYDIICVTSKTQSNEDNIVIGFMDKSLLQDLQIGESGLYSKNDDNVIQATIKLRKDGIMEINGNDDFMVRYSKLEKAFNELQDKFNTFANAYVPGGPANVGLPPTIQPSTADITEAKIDNVKTNSGE